MTVWWPPDNKTLQCNQSMFNGPPTRAFLPIFGWWSSSPFRNGNRPWPYQILLLYELSQWKSLPVSVTKCNMKETQRTTTAHKEPLKKRHQFPNRNLNVRVSLQERLHTDKTQAKKGHVVDVEYLLIVPCPSIIPLSARNTRDATPATSRSSCFLSRWDSEHVLRIPTMLEGL